MRRDAMYIPKYMATKKQNRNVTILVKIFISVLVESPKLATLGALHVMSLGIGDLVGMVTLQLLVDLVHGLDCLVDGHDGFPKAGDDVNQDDDGRHQQNADDLADEVGQRFHVNSPCE